MNEALLKDIISKLDKLDEKVTNFLGFFDLSPKEKAELRKDIGAYKEGRLGVVTLEEAEKLV